MCGETGRIGCRRADELPGGGEGRNIGVFSNRGKTFISSSSCIPNWTGSIMKLQTFAKHDGKEFLMPGRARRLVINTQWMEYPARDACVPSRGTVCHCAPSF